MSNTSCNQTLCGGGGDTRIVICPVAACPTLTVTPQTTIRDPNVRSVSYSFPDTMYFFDQVYQNIWITSKGYITFGSPFYSRTMIATTFNAINGSAIAAPFWADFDSLDTNITVNWYTSTNGSSSDAFTYNSILQRVINASCPSSFGCSRNPLALRVVRITWDRMRYMLPETNETISVSFTAYLINTYDTGVGSRPILRSYIAFEYTNSSTNLSSLRPFIGFCGLNGLKQIFNDPSSSINAAFLTERTGRSFFTGGRFLTSCEVTFLQQTQLNTINPIDNLNNLRWNPRFPCPCTLAQARSDFRFFPLQTENTFERSRNVVCYAAGVVSWYWSSNGLRWIRPQTCCYNQVFQGLITTGFFAGSVLSDPFQMFYLYPWQRRILFYDQCCSPVSTNGVLDWNTCQLYYRIHPPSTCTGYRAPGLVMFAGDPHVNTIDNGRYTCHIQGLYVFAKTTAVADFNARARTIARSEETDVLFEPDIFTINVFSVFIEAALPYVTRVQGYGSIFTNYTLIANNATFIIKNNNGKFGFSVNSDSSVSDNLVNNLNYEFTGSLDSANLSVYRLSQKLVNLNNGSTAPQLTLTLWSGLSIQCQIAVENLECILSLPSKYQGQIEGLIGNFDGIAMNDLINRNTNQAVPIKTTSSSETTNDTEILNACRSWIADATTQFTGYRAIIPSDLLSWYYQGNNSVTLSALNPLLSQTNVNQTCSSNSECVHDYVIRVNPITSGSTKSLSNELDKSISVLSETQPTISVENPVKITSPINTLNRIYSVPINITGARTSTITVTSNSTSLLNTTTNNVTIGSFNLTVPNNGKDYLNVEIKATYGVNSTLIQNLIIISCLCTNGGTCNFNQITTISETYQLAACICPAEYEGTFCESTFDGCKSASACKINWDSTTQCIKLNATEQRNKGRSYECNGICSRGYSSNNSITCDDINECTRNTSICGNGSCTNTIGSYLCQCSQGYTFNNVTCIDLNECTEPNSDGSFPQRCNNNEICINTIGGFNCSCPWALSSNGSCIANQSSCSGNLCNVSGVLFCRNGTTLINGTCQAWCSSTCPDFCDWSNGTFRCNCEKIAGFELTNNGQTCSVCDSNSYGVGCRQRSLCQFGTRNAQAVNETGSCNCSSNYQGTFCDKLIDRCAVTSVCNSATQDCKSDPSNGAAICSCQDGFTGNATLCIDSDECNSDVSPCDPDSSTCNNTFGSYVCICKSGYTSSGNKSCSDINECLTNSSCANYMNTYCVNLPGSYECRCSAGFSVGGDYIQAFGNIRNTNNSCLRTNFSSLCAGQCASPFICSADNGKCVCPPSTTFYNSSNTNETCRCLDHPLSSLVNGNCVSNINTTVENTWFILNMQSDTRVFLNLLNGSDELRARISNRLALLNIYCDGSCLALYETEPPTNSKVKIMVILNIKTNVTQRIQIAQMLLNGSLRYNNLPLRSMDIVLNPSANISSMVNFLVPPRNCIECEVLQTGSCSLILTQDICYCAPGYTGDYCRSYSTTTVQPLQSTTNTIFTVIIAIVSSAAGLLGLITLGLVCSYCISRRRRLKTKAAQELAKNRPFVLPRIHPPALGTVGRMISDPDDFSSIGDPEYNVDETNTQVSREPSLSTTYNATYRTDTTQRAPTDFLPFFEDLERRTGINSGNMPAKLTADMLGTLNSLPADLAQQPNTFGDSRDLDEIELVTDMLDDMTKDDEIDDDFIEALNPNLAIPRATSQDEEDSSSGWFTRFTNW